MAGLCISPATSLSLSHPVSFPHIYLDDLPGREVRIFPTNPVIGIDMSSTLSLKTGGHKSTASTLLSSMYGSSPALGFELGSHNIEPSDRYQEQYAERKYSQEHQSREMYGIGGKSLRSPFTGGLDPEVEALIARINKSVVIKNLATKIPQSILVPKGYLVEDEVKPSRFYEERTRVQDHVKKRKREGVLPRQTKKQWREERHGFRAQEIIKNGAVQLDGCKSSDLSNDIHPIFDRSNFDDTPDAIYDQLLPGLQLATMFLTQKICMQFWVTLAMGDRRNDPEMTSINGRLSQRIDTHVELTDERARTVIDHIKAIGKANLIHFRFKHRLQFPSHEESTAWGTSIPICEYRGIQKEYHRLKGDLVRSIIRIHSDCYVIAEKLSQLKYQEVSQKLRFNFLFAVLIIHELAHSIEGMHMKNRADQWIDWHSSRHYQEVYWLDWQKAECGRAWEETMFGGHIAPINNRVDGSHGIAISDWPLHGTENDPERRVWNTISMSYIEKLFQMSTWQRTFNLADWRAFNVPRDGATSLYINSFTTMSESEEERVATEELAELIALEHAQPAKKKRVKASGKMEERRLKDEKIVEEVVIEQEQQQPESAAPCISTSNDDKRRVSSSSTKDALPSQRLILAPHLRRPSCGQVKIPEPLSSHTPRHQKTAPTLSTAPIYPHHPQPLPPPSSHPSKELPTTISGHKTKPKTQTPSPAKAKARAKAKAKGLMAVHRQKKERKIELVAENEESERVKKQAARQGSEMLLLQQVKNSVGVSGQKKKERRGRGRERKAE